MQQLLANNFSKFTQEGCRQISRCLQVIHENKGFKQHEQELSEEDLHYLDKMLIRITTEVKLAGKIFWGEFKMEKKGGVNSNDEQLNRT